MNFDLKISHYKVVIFDKIFPMPHCTSWSKVIWSMLVGFNGQESNCEFSSWPNFQFKTQNIAKCKSTFDIYTSKPLQ